MPAQSHLRREVVAVVRVLLVAAGDVGLEGGGERQQHFRVDRADLATATRGGAGAAEDHARRGQRVVGVGKVFLRSEEHTSELQSLMRSSYAVFCLKKKT